MAILKSVVVSESAIMSPQGGGKIDIIGAFDNIVQPLFPMPILKLSIVLTLEEIIQKTTVEIRINSPSDELITKGEFELLVDPFGTGKKIIDLEKILLQERGTYTIDIIEKIGEENKFIATTKLFNANYPPQRPLNKEVIDSILEKEGVEVIQLIDLISQNPEEPLEEGYIFISKNDTVTVNGKEYDMTGIRRHVEWMYGSLIPKEEKKAKVVPFLNN